MQEYNDGSFGKIQKGSELLKKLADDQEELSKTKAVHFGSEQELNELKLKSGNAKRLMKKMEQLERKINRILIHLGADLKDEILVVD